MCSRCQHRPAARRHPRRPQRLMATCSADAPLKGLEYLLRAYARLLEEYPELELLLISKPNPGGKTEKLVRRLGIERRVQFVNGISTEDMVRYYAEATIAICPSVYEGFGLPAGEAMACGVPIVSTDGGALPEVVGDAGVAGALAQVAGLVEGPVQVEQEVAREPAHVVEDAEAVGGRLGLVEVHHHRVDLALERLQVGEGRAGFPLRLREAAAANRPRQGLRHGEPARQRASWGEGAARPAS